MTAMTTDMLSAPAPRLGETATILLGVALFLVAVAGATVLWGLPGLAMSALACVPVMFAVLLLITVGK